MKNIDIQLYDDDKDIDYTAAKRVAENAENVEIRSPMLIAWYDGVKGKEHPSIHECQLKPGWLAYAEGLQGCIYVDINLDMYGFIFTEADMP